MKHLEEAKPWIRRKPLGIVPFGEANQSTFSEKAIRKRCSP